MKQVRHTQSRMAEPSKAPDSRKSPLRLLIHEWCVGSNPTPVKFCVQKGNNLIEAVSNQTPVKFCVQKITFWLKQYFWESNQEQDEADFTLQEDVFEDRMKQVRFTQGRMAERSKAPDSRNFPLRLLIHECVRGFESHSCQILRSKRQHFNRSSISESQIKSKTKQISHYKKVLSKTGWSKCDILKAGWPSGLRRQTQENFLWGFWYTNVCVGSNPTPVKFCGQKGNILIEAVSNQTPVKFCVQKITFWLKQYSWESNQEQDEADFTLQEGVIEDRMKQVWYTQGRMAERSKAPDSRNSPSRLLVHECLRGFESHSCQILRSKRQHFTRSSIESNSCQILRSKNNILVKAEFLRVKSRARRSRFHITRRCYRRQDEASVIYSRQDGRAV